MEKTLRKIKIMLGKELHNYKLRTGESYDKDNYKDVISRVTDVYIQKDFSLFVKKDLYLHVGRIKALQELLLDTESQEQNKIVGVFYNDFTNYKISKNGKSIKVWDALGPSHITFKIKDAGTPFARFEARSWCGEMMQYFLRDFVKENK